MAADLHIHAFRPGTITEAEFYVFFGSDMGSRFEDGELQLRLGHEKEMKFRREMIDKTDELWIGEVSFLKAGLLEDDRFLPDPVIKVNGIVGEHFPIVDDELIKEITSAMDLGTDTNYEIADKEDVRKFLEEHRGWKLFTVAW